MVWAKLKPGEVDETIECVVTEFQRRRLPFGWQIGPTTTPSTLGADLLAHGLFVVEEEPGLALDLNAMGDDPPRPAELTIETVIDEAGLRDWTAVWGFGAPPDVRQRWFEVWSALGLGRDLPWRFYVGRWNGEAVATIKVFYAAGIAAVHHVVTLPAHRRRGIATALTRHAARVSIERGYGVAVLTASPMGLPIYERIGFRAFCQIQRYGWESKDR